MQKNKLTSDLDMHPIHISSVFSPALYRAKERNDSHIYAQPKHHEKPFDNMNSGNKTRQQ